MKFYMTKCDDDVTSYFQLNNHVRKDNDVKAMISAINRILCACDSWDEILILLLLHDYLPMPQLM